MTAGSASASFASAAASMGKKFLSSPAFRRRCRLLDSARGMALEENNNNGTNPHNHVHRHRRNPLPTFALKSHHVTAQLSSPTEFHQTLCDSIRNAKERVYLASLYIGPAVDNENQPRELEFLQAIENSTSPQIKILLDENRALRPIRTTSSAKATSQALSQNGTKKNQKGIHLFQVLSTPLAYLLPNPLNEVMGVFHMKLYIVDDMLIVSGANLSEEYFTDRQDRYFMVTKGGDGLTNFYAKLIDILCHHSTSYVDNQSSSEGGEEKKNDDVDTSTLATSSRQELYEQINQLFQDHNPKSSEELLSDPDTVAICIPTFHAPKGFFNQSSSSSSDRGYVSDIEATLGLLEEGSSNNNKETKDSIDGEQSQTVVSQPTSSTTNVQISSAYLNPTKDLLHVLKNFNKIDMMTAGRLSHGFAPKKPPSTPTNKSHPTTTVTEQQHKVGNKGKDWIPTVFDHLQLDAYKNLMSGAEKTPSSEKKNTSTTTAADSSPATTIWHWERPDWTFHSKGIWLQSQSQKSSTTDYSTNNMTMEAAIVGSSNFGGRSFLRDMESNLIMIFPPPSSSPGIGTADHVSSSSIVANRFQKEWDDMISNSKPVDMNNLITDAPPLPIHVRSLLPYIKSFF